MTRRSVSLSLLSALSAVPSRAATLPRPAPEFPVRLAGGRVVKPTDFKGKVVLFGFILTT